MVPLVRKSFMQRRVLNESGCNAPQALGTSSSGDGFKEKFNHRRTTSASSLAFKTVDEMWREERKEGGELPRWGRGGAHAHARGRHNTVLGQYLSRLAPSL